MAIYQHFLATLAAVLFLFFPLAMGDTDYTGHIKDNEFLDGDCEWSYCAGKMIQGQGTCDLIKGGIYTPRSWNATGCNWDAHRVQCCKECFWGKRCHEVSYGGDRACQEDYGSEYWYRGYLHPSACEDAGEPGEQFWCCKVYY